MDSSAKFFFVSMFVIQLFTTCVAQSPLESLCLYGRGNFTDSAHKTNLVSFFSSISVDTIKDYGFYNGSIGQNSDKVNAIALCRGDVSYQLCLGCIYSALMELRDHCPYQKEAIVWYDNCMFRYSNRSIFGVKEDRPNSFSLSLNKNAKNVTAFSDTLKSLLESLMVEAASARPSVKFAMGTNVTPDLETIHALVQCTPDLSPSQCVSCLSDFKIFLVAVARILTISCILILIPH